MRTAPLPQLLTLLLVLWMPAASAAGDFLLGDLDGRPVRLSDFRGQWVVVNFWASWCSPCVTELPELAAFQATNRGRGQVIGINFENTDRQHTRNFLAALPPTGFPHLKYDDDESGLPAAFFIDKTGQQLTLNGLPSSYFVDPRGELVGMHLGPVNAQTLHEKLLTLGFRPGP